MRYKAFTLVEIIIVITIIGVLTSIGLVSYGGLIEKQRLIMFGKDLLASAQRARAEVASGKMEDDKLLCAGLYFEEGGAPKKILTGFDAENNRCDSTTEIFTDMDQKAPNLMIDNIEVGGVAAGPIRILFVPPDGHYEVYADDEEMLAGIPVVGFSQYSFGIENGSDKIYVRNNEK